MLKPLAPVPSNDPGEGHSTVSRFRQQVEKSFSGLRCRLANQVQAQFWHGLWTSLCGLWTSLLFSEKPSGEDPSPQSGTCRSRVETRQINP